MKNQTFGIEIEMNHISRGMAAQVIAATLPSNTLGDGAVARYVGGSYDKWEVRGVDGQDGGSFGP